MSTPKIIDPYLTIRLPRVLVERVDQLRSEVAGDTDVDADGVRVSRHAIIDKALDLYELSRAKKK